MEVIFSDRALITIAPVSPHSKTARTTRELKKLIRKSNHELKARRLKPRGVHGRRPRSPQTIEKVQETLIKYVGTTPRSIWKTPGAPSVAGVYGRRPAAAGNMRLQESLWAQQAVLIANVPQSLDSNQKTPQELLQETFLGKLALRLETFLSNTI